MISRDAVLAYVNEKYGIEPDYPWARTPNYAVLRHAHNRKWFGAIADITEDKLGLVGNRPVDVLNLKCDPLLVGSLREQTGIFPAWHMNREHWITILLGSGIAREQVFSLVDMSFALTR